VDVVCLCWEILVFLLKVSPPEKEENKEKAEHFKHKRQRSVSVDASQLLMYNTSDGIQTFNQQEISTAQAPSSDGKASSIQKWQTALGIEMW